MNIKDYPELLEASDSDWILIQENSTIPAYKKIQLINLQGTNTSSQGTSNWIYRDGSIDFTIEIASKFLIDTPRDVSVNLSNLPGGAEVELKRLRRDNSLFLTGISKIQGKEIDSSASIAIPFNDNSTRLIYVNSSVGWIFIPESSAIVLSSLNLPPEGLTQLFYAGNILSTGLVSQWQDEISNNSAIQNNVDQQAEYVSSIFAEQTIGGLLFNGSQEYEVDLNYLAGEKYTIAIVEARIDNDRLYLFGNNNGSTNSALHVGFRSNTSFTLAQFSNDLNASISGYQGFEPTLWIVSNNSRGKEIYKNGVLIDSSSDTRDLVSSENGRIGSAIGDFYKGYLGLIAVWIGDKTLSQIQEINSAVNSTFQVI